MADGILLLFAEATYNPYMASSKYLHPTPRLIYRRIFSASNRGDKVVSDGTVNGNRRDYESLEVAEKGNYTSE